MLFVKSLSCSNGTTSGSANSSSNSSKDKANNKISATNVKNSSSSISCSSKNVKKKWVDRIGVFAAIHALLVYLNTLKAGFVYDDSRAILTNPDLHPETPWTELWKNDYWGTPLFHSGSHKSFRPLTVLTFRWNFYLSSFTPWPYHLTNILLHALSTWLFVRLARLIFRKCGKFKKSQTSIAVLGSSLLFASHPVHSEAVAGIVGRADLLSTVLALGSFLLYANHIKWRERSMKSIENLQQQHQQHNQITTNTTTKGNHGGTKSGNNNKKKSNYVKSSSNNSNSGGGSSNSSTAGCEEISGEINQNSCHDHRGCSRLKAFLYLILSIGLSASSMLAKEQGLTILLICALYDTIQSLQKLKKRQNTQNQGPNQKWSPFKLQCMPSLIVLFVSFLLLFRLRVWFMGGLDMPLFSKADNPTSHESSFLTRCATFFYLPCFNLMLLLYPTKLSFDWSMDSIARITSPSDSRNLITLSFYTVLTYSVYKSIRFLVKSSIYQNSSQNLSNSSSPSSSGRNTPTNIIQGHKKKHGRSCLVCRELFNSSQQLKFGLNNNNSDDSNSSTGFKIHHNRTKKNRGGRGNLSGNCAGRAGSNSLVLLMELGFLIIPFIPCTNLFFYVGFVVAERVLYMPSLGFCLLVGRGFGHIYGHKNSQKSLIATCGISLLLLCSLRTILRNEDWVDEERLYRSGIEVNPAKSWGNLASILSNQGRMEEAEEAYRKALSFRNNMADVYYNLGLLLERQGRLSEALVYYRSAIHFRPRLAAAYVNAGQTLARMDLVDEAIEFYTEGYQLPDDGVKDLKAHQDSKVTALLRLGKLLVDRKNNPKRALQYYRQAVKMMSPNYSQLQHLYSAMGEALHKIGDSAKAEEWFKASLKADPLHIPSQLTYGKMLASNKTRLLEAESWFRRAKKLAPSDSSVYHQYGQFLAHQGRYREAIESSLRAVDLAPNDYEIVLGVANVLKTAGDFRRAQYYYEKASEIKPTHKTIPRNVHQVSNDGSFRPFKDSNSKNGPQKQPGEKPHKPQTVRKQCSPRN